MSRPMRTALRVALTPPVWALKTAASAGDAADAGETGDPEPPKVRAPRKRAAKKTAAPAPAAEDSADDLLALAELIAAGPSARSDEPTTQLSWPETVTSDDAAAAVPLEFIDRTSLLGSVDRVADRMRAYADAGVTTLSVAIHAGSTDESLRQLRLAAQAYEKSGLT